ncbi:MAG: flavodoxin family protein [Candidatus Thorarchaeota archaeon]
MNCIIIYKSIHHENTLKVAHVFAEELDADLVSLDDIQMDELEKYDLVGLGSGIYLGKHHRKLLEFVDESTKLVGKDIFVFYTSGFERFPTRRPFETALTEKLKKKGARVISTFSCRGWETYGLFRLGGGKNKGHPTEDDLDQARSFAKSLINDY